MQARSLGIGNVADGELTLRPNAAFAEDPEQSRFRGRGSSDGRISIQVETPSSGAGNDGGKGDVDQSIAGYEEPIVLTQSTHSFLFTERTCSVPFAFALAIVGISYTCLILALYNNIYEDSSPGNPLNLPVGVTFDVRAAQYLALLIGLLMEEEIPESLYLLRMISERTLRDKAPDLKFGKFVFCACVRILMGYLFYFNMFIVVAQATAVIDIFYDVLALQFLQQVDDIAFGLAMRDVFGKKLKRATTRKCFRAEFEKLPFARRKRMSRFVKILYVLNFVALMAGMTIITVKQKRGDYHCRSITVKFDDKIWEDALVLDSTGEVKKMDLIYSYFNGVYNLTGFNAGRPIYTEQNKFDNGPYEEDGGKIGATIQYCKEEGAWVFMHENIRKDRFEIEDALEAGRAKSDHCPWLLRSPETKSFNLLEVPNDWSIWTGVITTATLQTTCNGCDSEAECNYHGTCADDRECTCELSEDDGYPLYAGVHCEYPRPCLRLTSEAGSIWNVVPVEENGTLNTWKAYGRGVYLYSGGSAASDVPEEDALLLIYSGSRWFGSYYPGGRQRGRDYWLRYSREFHAFWDEVYKENTQYVSNPTARSDPIAVDFFAILRRGAKYGPLGELKPLVELPGSGYFECPDLNMTVNEFLSEILEKGEWFLITR